MIPGTVPEASKGSYNRLLATEASQLSKSRLLWNCNGPPSSAWPANCSHSEERMFVSVAARCHSQYQKPSSYHNLGKCGALLGLLSSA